VTEKLSVLGPDRTVGESVETRRPAPFTAKEKRVLETYVRDLANKLGLRDWIIELEWDITSDDDADADIIPLYGRRCASIRFARSFRRQTPENQRYTVVHELLHCHMAPIDELVRRSAEGLLGSAGSTAVLVAYDQSSETAVDGIAASVAELLPVPRLPDDS
jgi:hypothetical protein